MIRQQICKTATNPHQSNTCKFLCLTELRQKQTVLYSKPNDISPISRLSPADDDAFDKKHQIFSRIIILFTLFILLVHPYPVLQKNKRNWLRIQHQPPTPRTALTYARGRDACIHLGVYAISKNSLCTITSEAHCWQTASNKNPTTVSSVRRNIRHTGQNVKAL